MWNKRNDLAIRQQFRADFRMTLDTFIDIVTLVRNRLEKEDRRSHHRRSIKIDVLKNFVKFTGKHLCQSLFFNKVAVASETKTFLRMHAFFIAIFQ